MAFNPFNVFRRNQKILFALLTVLVMFMFVLSFGQGDFFSSVPRWLGSTRHSGEVIAVNSEVEATPGLINEDALGRGWLFRIKLADSNELGSLMDESAYANYVKTLS